jgi:hypothetical protein
MAEGKFGHRVLDVILIVSACFVLYFWDLGHAPFFDKQEPREALVVWEINHSGNWILPLRNGNEIPAKLSLYHWLAALVSQSAGRIDEFTIRLPSAFLGTAGVLLIYFAEHQLLANCLSTGKPECVVNNVSPWCSNWHNEAWPQSSRELLCVGSRDRLLKIDYLC